MISENGTPYKHPLAHVEMSTSSLDLSNPKDQALARRAMADWPKRYRKIDDATKDGWVDDLRIAEKIGRGLAAADDIDVRCKAADILLSTVRTGVMMEGQNQKDEHFAVDVQRGAGLGDQHVSITVNRPRVMKVTNENP